MTPEEKRAKRAAYMREYTARNKDKVNQQRRARRTPETLEREKAWRAANRDKCEEYDRKYEQANPDKVKAWKTASADRRKDERNRRAREAHAANPEKERIRSRRRYQSHGETIRLQAKLRNQNSPHRYWLRYMTGRHAAMARQAGVSIEKVDWDAILIRDCGICGICGKAICPDELTFDHILELSAGGPHCEANIQLAHLSCNSAKSNTGEGRQRRGSKHSPQPGC